MAEMTRCGKAFCVVQFIELPFEGIDDYVCVPNNWLIVRRARDQKASVKYPKDEDPFDTRDRAKRKERFDDEWRSFMAAVKYESITYWDAELWIATRNDYGPLVEERSKIIVTQPRLTLNKKLSSANQSPSLKSNNNPRKPLQIQSIKRPALSEPKKQLEGKRLKLNESAQSSRADINDANTEPGCSWWDNHSMECRQTEETAAVSNGVSSSSQRRNGSIQESTPKYEQTGLNNAPIDVDVPSVAGTDNEEVQSTSILEKKLYSARRSMEEQSSMITQNSLQGGTRVLTPHIGNSSDTTARLRSIAISSQEIQLIPNINVKNSLVMAAVDPRNVLQSDTNIASVSQSLPSSFHQRPSFVRRLDKHQSSQAQEQYPRHSQQTQYLSKKQDNFDHDLLRRSTESNNRDHRPNSRTIRMRNPFIRQNSTHPSNSMYHTSELPQQSQSQPNQQDSRRQPQKPEIRIGISIKPKNNRKIPTLQGVTKTTHPPIVTNVWSSIRQALLSTHNTYLLHEHQLQARQSESVLVNESLLNEMDDACHVNECMGAEPLSPYSDNEISTDEVEPADTTNNVYGTGIASGSKLADRPTAAQTSTSPNPQTHPRVVLEQQMLDNFATLFTQMGNTLRYTCDMYNNLRSSIFETAKMYKSLLVTIEQFNALANSASNPPPSSNLSPQIPQASGNRQTEVTARANSSNQDQHSNDVVNKAPKKNHSKVWRYVLPPQHDPHDTK